MTTTVIAENIIVDDNNFVYYALCYISLLFCYAPTVLTCGQNNPIGFHERHVAYLRALLLS